MAWDLTLAEQHAREQIARTLHDGLQQLLVIVALNLEQQLKREHEAERAERAADRGEAAARRGDRRRAVAERRAVSSRAAALRTSGRPDVAGELDAGKVQAERRDRRRPARGFHAEGCPHAAVRVGQGAALQRGQVRQTRSRHVALALDADDQLSITVTDQGVGFDPARLDDRSKADQMGWGLFRIRERLTLLGGRLDIESAPGRGRGSVWSRRATPRRAPSRRERARAVVRPERQRRSTPVAHPRMRSGFSSSTITRRSGARSARCSISGRSSRSSAMRPTDSRRSRRRTRCGPMSSSWTSRCRTWTASKRQRASAPSSRISGFSGCRCCSERDRGRDRAGRRGGVLRQGDRHAAVDRRPAGLSRGPRPGDRAGT